MDAAVLIVRWAERDNRYALRWQDGRPAPLTNAECAAIRTFRLAEAADLPFGKGRAAAYSYISNWRRPRAVVWRDPVTSLDEENERARRRYNPAARRRRYERTRGSTVD